MSDARVSIEVHSTSDSPKWTCINSDDERIVSRQSVNIILKSCSALSLSLPCTLSLSLSVYYLFYASARIYVFKCQDCLLGTLSANIVDWGFQVSRSLSGDFKCRDHRLGLGFEVLRSPIRSWRVSSI